MPFILNCRRMLLAGIFIPSFVWAQSTNAQIQAAHPTEPSREPAPPTLGFTSSFSGYQAHRDPEPVAWKKANEDVRQIGGWRAYAKESQPAAASEAQQAPTSGAKN